MSEPSTAELALAEALWDAFMHQFHDSLIASNAAPLAVEIALAAGWVPPEEAETLRRERDRCIDQRTVALARAADARARVRELESVPPERVETIDCPRAEHGFQEHGAGPPASWVCPTCKNSGKLQIVRAE